MRTRSVLIVPAAAMLFAASNTHAAPPRFAAAFQAYPASFNALAVTTADLNGDGHPDVLFVDDHGLEVRLGTGDGTLGPSTTFVSNLPRFVVAGDLDGDGQQDVVVSADSLHAGVRRGNGDGTFQPLTLFSIAKGPAGAVLVDLRGNGHLDLVCTAERDHAVSILLGDGAGGFAAHVDVLVGASPGGIAAGDLNHDGHVDVVVADRGASAMYVLLGDGAGHLALSATVALPVPTVSVALADLDGDGWLDAVAGTTAAPACVVIPGLPGGAFGTPTSLAFADYTYGIAVTDLDGDGHPDVAALEPGRNSGEVRRGLGGFAFAPAQRFGASRIASALACADLNGGGKPDLVSIGQFGTLSVHMGNGDGTFGGAQDLATGPLPWGIAAGDLDADGHADWVTTNIGDATLSIRFGLGGGAFAPPVTLATGVEPHGVTIADADGDGHLDLVVAENGPGTQSASTVAIFFGDGARGFAPRVTFTVGRWCEQVAVADLTGDGLPDLAVADDDYLSTLTVLTGLGGRQWGNRQDILLGSNSSGVAVGDVTRDGKPDIVLAGYYSNTVSVLPGHANGTYGSPLSFSVTAPVGVAIGDVLGDASPDVIVAGDAGLSVFPSITGGDFGPRVDFSGGAGPIVAADFDADGRIDVATANGWQSNAVSVWFGQGGGGLGPVTAYGGGDRPFGVASADFDEDGTIDLACANLESNSVSLLLNTGGVAWIPWLGAPPPAAPSTAFGLRASPNPAHGATTFRYVLPRAAHVRLRLLDVAGRERVALERGERPAGEHRIAWNARGVPAGVVFLELEVDGDRVVKRIVVLP